jgi:DNA-binding LacI/PurR family transcriptional regulator
VHKKVSQKDIAKAAGVAQSAVSAVLGNAPRTNTKVSEEIQTRIKRIASELGYRPNMSAQQLRGVKSHLIGIFLTSEFNYFRYELMQKVIRSIYRHGYNPLVAPIILSDNLEREYQNFLDDFSSRGVEGAIWLSCRRELYKKAPDCLEVFNNKVITVEPMEWNADGNYVEIDYVSGISSVVDYFMEKKRKKISIILSDMCYSEMKGRFAGYEQGLSKHGLPKNPDLIWIHPEKAPKLEDEYARLAIEQCVIKGGANAIVASNDQYAVRLIKTLKKMNIRVPEDVAVIGFDNITLSAESVDPELTSLDHDAPAIADFLVDSIVDIIENKNRKTPVRKKVKPKLVIRESA